MTLESPSSPPSPPAARHGDAPASASPTALLRVVVAETLLLWALVALDQWLAPAVRSAWPGYPEYYLIGLGVLAVVGFCVMARALRGSYLSVWAGTGLGGSAEPGGHPLREIVATRLATATAYGAVILVPYAIVRAGGAVVLSVIAAVLVAVWQALAARAECRSDACETPRDEQFDTPLFQEAMAALRRFADAHGEGDVHIRILTGLGSGRAVYVPTRPRATVAVPPELVRQATPAEMQAVFAHELAHHKLRHSCKSVAARILWMFLAVVLTAAALDWFGPGERDEWAVAHMAPAALLVWYMLLVVSAPAVQAYLRRQELQACRLALAMTDRPDAFVSAMRKAAPADGAAAPNRLWVWLTCDAPPLADVLAVADAYERSKSSPPASESES